MRSATVAFLITTATTVSLTAQTTASTEYTREARGLAASPAITDAFRIVEDLDAWALQRLIELTEIPAPPFMEEARGAASPNS